MHLGSREHAAFPMIINAEKTTCRRADLTGVETLQHSPLRVCHLGKYYPPASGGIETHLQTLAQGQARLGLNVEVLCMNHQPGPTVREKDGPIAVTRFRSVLSVKKLEVSPALLWALRRVQADILHMQVPNPTMTLAVALAQPRTPLVVTYQSDVVRQRILGALFRPVERFVYRRVKQVLPTSLPYAEGSTFLASYRDRIRVLPMGIDLEPYLNPSEDDRHKTAELQTRYPGPLWLACGRLVYYKGLYNAIHAIANVPGTLLIVGDGPERAILEGYARATGVADRVVFLGNLPCRQIVPYYHAATAFWFPSNFKSEAFGLVQVEAMASGCPVINTQIPASGVSWVSRDEESGLTVPVDDPHRLAAAARRLLNEPGLRDRLAQGARERAMRDFDCQVMAQRSLDVYDFVLDRRGAGRKA
jgi:glycosyltransferase involved in cell wall biosynthesis